MSGEKISGDHGDYEGENSFEEPIRDFIRRRGKAILNLNGEIERRMEFKADEIGKFFESRSVIEAMDDVDKELSLEEKNRKYNEMVGAGLIYFEAFAGEARPIDFKPCLDLMKEVRDFEGTTKEKNLLVADEMIKIAANKIDTNVNSPDGEAAVWGFFSERYDKNGYVVLPNNKCSAWDYFAHGVNPDAADKRAELVSLKLRGVLENLTGFSAKVNEFVNRVNKEYALVADKDIYLDNPDNVYDLSFGPQWRQSLIDGPYDRDRFASRKADAVFLRYSNNWVRTLVDFENNRGSEGPIVEALPPSEEKMFEIVDQIEGVCHTFTSSDDRYVILAPKKYTQDKDAVQDFMNDELPLRERVAGLLYPEAKGPCAIERRVPRNELMMVKLPIYPDGDKYERKFTLRKSDQEDLEFAVSQYFSIDTAEKIRGDAPAIFGEALLENAIARLPKEAIYDADALTAEEKDYFLDEHLRKRVRWSYKDKHKDSEDKVSFRDYVNKFVEVYNVVSPAFEYSGDLSSDTGGNPAGAITDSLMRDQNPLEKARRLSGIVNSSLPGFAKRMAASLAMYPTEHLREDAAFKIHSPVLNKALIGQNKDMPMVEEIIYRDLLKAAFGSKSSDLGQFLDELEEGAKLMEKIRTHEIEFAKYEADGLTYADDDIGEKERFKIRKLARALEILNGQTFKNLQADNADYLIGAINEENAGDYITKIYEIFRPTFKYSLADRVVRMFCWPLKIESLEGAREYLGRQHSNADKRNRVAVENRRIGNIRTGDFVKSIHGARHLAEILESGILAREYLGTSDEMDATPFDADVAMVTGKPDGLRDAIQFSSAAYFSSFRDGGVHRNGDVFLVFQRRGQFERSYSENERGHTLAYSPEKYEVFGPMGEMDRYYDDFGIRTGLPSSEIDYIAISEDVYPQVRETVAKSPFYIPVTDLDGKLLFTPQEYDKMRDGAK